jgi:hypothetical protein
MFSTAQKRQISDAVQKILRDTNHPELPKEGEIKFHLYVEGAEPRFWADILNNCAVSNPIPDPWSEDQDPKEQNDHLWNVPKPD